MTEIEAMRRRLERLDVDANMLAAALGEALNRIARLETLAGMMSGADDAAQIDTFANGDFDHD